MRSGRAVVALSLVCTLATSHATWVATRLSPGVASVAFSGEGNVQVGIVTAGAQIHAAMWTGTAGSIVDLNPAGATESSANAASGSKQGGYAVFGGVHKAGIWSGTAASWVDLSPAGATESEVDGLEGGKQVGYAVVGGVYRACVWSGTAASCVFLSSGSIGARAYGVLGSKQVGGQNSRACMWSGTEASKVDIHPSSMSASVLFGMSATNQVGYCQNSNFQQHASLWSGTAGSWIDLNPAGSTISRSYAVFGAMQVGESNATGKNHGGYWMGTAASWHDLHGTLPANFDFSSARSISYDAANDIQRIAGSGSISGGDTEAILWTQVGPDNFELTLNKASVAGQNSVQGTITAGTTNAASRIFTVTDNSSLVTTPGPVTVAAGASVKNFQITVLAVTSSINTMITAKRGSVTRSQPLTLAPLIPTALSFTPNPVTGGQTTTGKVVINGVAGPGGRTIALIDNSAYASEPSTVTVPPGASSVTFPITTLAVTSGKNVTVTAKVSAGQKIGTFRINP